MLGTWTLWEICRASTKRETTVLAPGEIFKTDKGGGLYKYI